MPSRPASVADPIPAGRIGLRITIPSALNRPVEDWGKVLGDTAAVSAMLDRLLHHAHILKSGPRSWRTKLQTDLQA
jgi:DNA replication protein DnaC